ncbi:MAG: FIST C-terminal domain-containing protein [Rhodospirillales bacterium]|nr:FIST C-terminal domain-containing protein [Rhodospirillales bacterium]
MFFAVVAHSEDIDAQGILEDLLDQCRDELGDRVPQAAILYCTIDLEHDQLVQGIDDAWPGIALVGCTTDGEFSSRIGYREDSAALILLGSDTVEITAGLGRDVSKDITAACVQAIASATSGIAKPPALCITLPESLTTSGQQIVEALGQGLGPNVPVVGATAGDSFLLTGTHQFSGREVCSDSVPILLFSGPLLYSVAVASGWKPMGEPGLVTRSAGTVVHEIDGLPAIDFYRQRLGEQAVPGPEIPLALLDGQGAVECLRATAAEYVQGTGAITFLGDVREGAMVQITVANRSAILNGCEESISKAFAGYPHGKTPAAALVFSCAARKLLLGTHTSEEIGIVQSVIGAQVPVCGFYGYGEIGPRDNDDPASKYHNETFVSLVLGS